MDVTRQETAIHALREWSKWLIGLDFAAATGCVVVLQGGISGSPFLILAIASFALSVVCSILVVRALAWLVEILPMRDASGEITTIYDFRVWHEVSLARVVSTQMTLFFAGLAFFLGWVVF